MKRGLLILILSCASALGANVTNVWSGLQVWPGMQLSTVPSASAPTIDRSGLVIEWAMDAGSGNTLTNLATTQPFLASVNQLPASEHHFNVSSYLWFLNNSSSTVTDGYGTDPNGVANNASRFVTSSGGYVNMLFPCVAGQSLTYSVYLKSNAATNQQVRFGFTSGGKVLGSDVTVTPSWQRFSITYGSFTTANYIFSPIYSGSASLPTDVLVWGSQMEYGTSASAYTGMDMNWHANLGYTRVAGISSAPTWTGSGLNFPNSTLTIGAGFGSQLVSNVTVYVVFRRPWNAPRAVWFLCSDLFNVGNLHLGQTFSMAQADFNFAGATLMADTTWNDGLWHVATGTYDGANLGIWLDGAMLNTATASKTPFTLTDFQVANVKDDSRYGFDGDQGYLLLYTNAHSASQIANTVDALKTKLAGRGVSVGRLPYFVLSEGDSRTIADASYIRQALTNAFGFNIHARVFATLGATFSTITNRAPTVDAAMLSWGTNVLQLLIGVNDWSGMNPTNYVALLKGYCLDRRAVAAAAGKNLKIALCTELPALASVRAGWNAERNTMNLLLRADSSFYDTLCDLGANPTMGPDAAASDSTLYGDGLHPTVLGHTYLSTDMAASLRLLIP